MRQVCNVSSTTIEKYFLVDVLLLRFRAQRLEMMDDTQFDASPSSLPNWQRFILIFQLNSPL